MVSPFLWFELNQKSKKPKIPGMYCGSKSGSLMNDAPSLKLTSANSVQNSSFVMKMTDEVVGGQLQISHLFLHLQPLSLHSSPKLPLWKGLPPVWVVSCCQFSSHFTNRLAHHLAMKRNKRFLRKTGKAECLLPNIILTMHTDCLITAITRLVSNRCQKLVTNATYALAVGYFWTIIYHCGLMSKSLEIAW